MKISIEFNTDNAAFDDDCSFNEDGMAEIRQILIKLSDRIRPDDSGPIRDINGNTVGTWSWE